MLICKKPKIFDVDFYAFIILAGLGAATWWVLIKPLNEKVSQQQLDQAEQRQSHEAAQAELVNMEELTRQERILAFRLQQTGNILQDNASVPEVIRNMERFCRLGGLRLEEINPQADTFAEHFRKTGLYLRLSGVFPQGQLLLARIKKELPYVRLRSLEIVTKNAPQNLCEIIIELDIFSAR